MDAEEKKEHQERLIKSFEKAIDKQLELDLNKAPKGKFMDLEKEELETDDWL